jgi:hypothetical protein
MSNITLEISENQLLEWLKQLPPSTKKLALKAIIPDLSKMEELVDYGSQRIQAVCAERGIDWNALDETQRNLLIDEILHEA